MAVRPSFRSRLALALVAFVALAGCVESSGSAASPADDDEPRTPVEPPGPEVPPLLPEGNVALSKRVVNVTSTFVGIYPAVMTYEPAQLEVDHGVRVRLTFHNADHNPLGKHTWKLQDVSNRTQEVPVGDSDTIEFDAPAPGTYTYVCDVPQHEELGMKGDFVVR